MDYKTRLLYIEFIKNKFQNLLHSHMKFMRVSSPLFLEKNSGLNDDLNGEEKVSFEHNNNTLEIVQSLAKWKRYALYKYNINSLYADMNAIRKMEIIDNIHSIYVDQWDWESIVDKQEDKFKILMDFVNKIYRCIYDLDTEISKKLSREKLLPETIYPINSERLLKEFPNLTPKEREHEIAKRYRAVFIMKIGKKLSNGTIHDNRAPDYDDWEFNGDIIFWNPCLNQSIEISSMGYRVNADTMLKQLTESNQLYKKNLMYHKMILNNELPQTIGGGIGQSRLCMFLLQLNHIGEVQSSFWDNNEKTFL